MWHQVDWTVCHGTRMACRADHLCRIRQKDGRRCVSRDLGRREPLQSRTSEDCRDRQDPRGSAGEVMILDCGHLSISHSAVAMGYGKNQSGDTSCYECCAQHTRQCMMRDGKTALYLAQNDAGAWEVTDWPGYLRFPAYGVKQGKQRRGCCGPLSVTQAYFLGPDGKTWSARVIGDMQIARCRRLKGRR